MEQKKLIIHDEDTIREMSTFIARGNSYEADHNSFDDLMMNLVLFGWFSSTVFFKESTDVRLKHMLYKEKVKQLQDEVIPIGNMPKGMEEHPFGKEWKVWNG